MTPVTRLSEEWAGWSYQACNVRGHPTEEHWHPPVGQTPTLEAREREGLRTAALTFLAAWDMGPPLPRNDLQLAVAALRAALARPETWECRHTNLANDGRFCLNCRQPLNPPSPAPMTPPAAGEPLDLRELSATEALQRLIESADFYEGQAKSSHVWDENGSTETIIRGIQQYRAALARPETQEEAGTAWLIERGQPEGLDRPEWWSVTARWGTNVGYGWSRDAWKAVRYSSQEEAESVIARFDRPGHPFHARAVLHGFVASSEPVR